MKQCSHWLPLELAHVGPRARGSNGVTSKLTSFQERFLLVGPIFGVRVLFGAEGWYPCPAVRFPYPIQESDGSFLASGILIGILTRHCTMRSIAKRWIRPSENF